MRLYDLARVVRSKNAGPFALTIDVILGSGGDLERVLASPSFTAERIAGLYGAAPETVSIRPFARVFAVKVTLPRPAGSGSPDDRDVYGSQQHVPLADIDV